MVKSSKAAELVLENGSVYQGYSFGYEKSIAGEVVFNTGMVGYSETLTDPSYRGQILVFTYPLMGNYGVPDRSRDNYGLLKNFESNKIQACGIITSEHSTEYSHHSSVLSLSSWLKKNQIPALSSVDTRSLTMELREKGVMFGKIIIKDKQVGYYNPNKNNLVAEASINKPVIYRAGSKRVILIDCGTKLNIIRSLLLRKVAVVRVPWDYDILNNKFKFDGVVISNGPGNPANCEKLINNLKKLLRTNIPILGICLGNQLLALAAGASTYKLKYGHRSQNQPCLDLTTNKCYMTSQNHGYAIVKKTIPADWQEWFININDKTNEGIKHKKKPFLSVQFHPEACPGPVDTEFVFDNFINLFK